jgi:PAS domain S-box-containing protein
MILDSSGVGIAVTNEEGIFVYLNKTYAAICARPAMEILNQHFELLVAPEEREAAKQHHFYLLQGKECSTPVEGVLVRKDGSRRLISSSNRLLVRGSGQRFRVATVTDLTDTKEAEKALQEKDQRFQNSMDVIPGLVFQYRRSSSRTYSFDYISQGARDLLGIEPGAGIKDENAIWNLVWPEDLEILRETRDESAATRGRWFGQFRVRTAEGVEKWLRHNSKPQIQQGGGIVWHGIMLDITAEMNVQHTIEKDNQAKTEFLAYMSHELRTPLNAILGYCQLHGQDRTLGTDLQNSLRAINRAGDHILELVNNILDLVRLEADAMPLNPVLVNPRQLFQDVKSIFWANSQAKGLSFEFLGLENLPPQIQVDAPKLRQILVNLLGNAIRYTRNGGVRLQVVIAPARPELDPNGLTLSLFPGRTLKCLEIIIEDTGIGIDPRELTELFIPFKLTRSGRELGKGAGLGLAITQQLLDLMGGQIQVESNVGRGSLFRCRLPVVVIDNDLEVVNEFPRLDMHQQDSRPIRRISDIDRFAGLVLLPHELIQDLRQAALRCDPERLRSLLLQVATTHSSLAERLQQELDNFAFHSILYQINLHCPLSPIQP